MTAKFGNHVLTAASGSRNRYSLSEIYPRSATGAINPKMARWYDSYAWYCRQIGITEREIASYERWKYLTDNSNKLQGVTNK